MTDIPSSWAIVPIIDILEPNQNGKPFQQGWSPQCENHPASDDTWGVLKTTAIQAGEYWDHENKQLPQGLAPRPHLEVKAGDLLMTCAGPRSRCGVVCLVDHTRSKLMMSGKMYRFRPNTEIINPHFLTYFIQSRSAQVAIDRMKTGISDSGLNLTHDRFATLNVPLAPPSEQTRIVDKIEELFSGLDKGVESLTTAREQLKAYRQSVLKHAFEGKLTEEWRAKNSSKLENTDVLVDRIKNERETLYKAALDEWHTALHQWREGGEKGRKPPKPHKPAWPAKTSFSSLNKLPDNWFYLPFEALAWSIRNGISAKPDEIGPLKIFRISAVRPMHFRLQDFRRITDLDGSMEDYRLKYGDLVFTRYNGSRDYVGVSAMYRGDGSHVYPDKLIRCEIKSAILNPSFLERATNCGESRAFLEKRIRTTAGQSGISGGDIKSMPVAICSPAEQAEIVTQLDRALLKSDVMLGEIETALARADALRQSILTQAFSGRLVRQNPADGPVSILLERIRTEQEEGSTVKRRHNKNGKKEAA